MASPGQIWIALCLLVLSMLHRKLRAMTKAHSVGGFQNSQMVMMKPSCEFFLLFFFLLFFFFFFPCWRRCCFCFCYCTFIFSLDTWLQPAHPQPSYLLLPLAPPSMLSPLHLIGLQISSPSAFMSLYISFLEWGPVNGLSSNTSDRFLNARFPQR